MEASSLPTTVVYEPQPRVLGRKILALSLVALAVFAGSVFMKIRHGDAIYLREILPVHLMMASLIGLYLVYLNYTLFRSLAAGYRVIRDAQGLEIHGEGRTSRLEWGDIRQIRFGDLYLKIDAYEGRFEIPFIPRDKQREIFRCHQRAAGLKPDVGRFLQRHARPRADANQRHNRTA